MTTTCAVYTLDGNQLCGGLQGSKICDEAIQTAQYWADQQGTDVHLVDDDGEWIVHPEIEGGRESADAYQNPDAEQADEEIGATIAERGNGFPDIGDRIYHADSDTIYEIVSMGRIQTAQYASNWVDAVVEDTGDCASDLSDKEFEGLSDCRITLAD